MESGHEGNFLEDIHDGWEFVECNGRERSLKGRGRWVGTGRFFRKVSDEVQTTAVDTIRNRSLGTDEFRYSDANRNVVGRVGVF